MLLLFICLCHHFETARASSMICVNGRRVWQSVFFLYEITSSFLRVRPRIDKKKDSVSVTEGIVIDE